MIDFSQLEDSFYPLLSTLAGVETIISHQSAPRPATPYAVFEIRELNPLGRGSRGYVDDNGDSKVTSDYELLINIQVIGPNARTIAAKIKNAFNQETTILDFLTAGFAYSRAAPVRHVPAILETDWEERAILEIIFFISDQTDENVSCITNVSIEACYSNFRFTDFPSGVDPFVFDGDTSGLGFSSIGEAGEGGSFVQGTYILTHTLIINSDETLCP